MRTIRFFEYDGFELPSGEISTKISDLPYSLQEIEVIAKIAGFHNGGSAVFEIDRETIRARSIVGSIAYGNIQVDVVPKLLKVSDTSREDFLSNLMHMLSYTSQLDIFDAGYASKTKGGGTFIDAYITIFANRIVRYLQRNGTPRMYVGKSERIDAVRGKINIARNIQSNLRNQSKVFCEFTEFSENNALAGVLKYVCLALKNHSRNSQAQTRLNQAVGQLAGVDARALLPHEFDQLPRVRDRELVILTQFARFFVCRLRPEFGRSERNVSIAILFDMNELFEEYVFQLLSRNRKALGINVMAQRRKSLVTYERDLSDLPQGTAPKSWDKKNLFSTFSDIEVRFNDGRSPIILDTKYKMVGKGAHYGISNADAYQILAYGQIHKTQNLKHKVALIYPQSEIRFFREFKVGLDEATFFAVTLDMSVDLKRQEAAFLQSLTQALGVISKSS